ncbi:hypothetical protein BV25DRAFT_709771 [Artomyces pyxidatus]|uniref:Uncharacterized protein n=1 Tax=Artomyces pyxidatus TaxID=48021 RepID=A0ACB8T080_9AGAM|nr:hypothetical protein BV25DRAFT_709771 [Artomyces pyxidatus]
MSLSGLLLRIQNHNNSWRISEKRLREIRGKGLADGRLKQPLLEQGLKMRPDEHDVQLREEQYVFKILWRRARRAGVCELIRKFEVTSGEFPHFQEACVFFASRPTLLGILGLPRSLPMHQVPDHTRAFWQLVRGGGASEPARFMCSGIPALAVYTCYSVYAS